MRRPTDLYEAHAWHRAVLAIIGDAQGVEAHRVLGEAIVAGDANVRIAEDEIKSGWFKRRLRKGCPWVPVRIWIHQVIDDAGELLEPERFACSVDGRAADPVEQWPRVCMSPIAEHEFEYLTALRAWQRVNEPEAWDPLKPVDLTRTAIEE